MRCLCLTILFYVSQPLVAATVVNHIGPQSHNDQRLVYDNAVLKLALDNTRDDFGAYILNRVSDISLDRASVIAKDNAIENFVFKNSASNDVLQDLGYVNFPIDLGIVGYRVFLTNIETQKHLVNVKDINQLQQYSLLQGIGWLDTKILRYNSFNVIIGPDYDGLFSMINSGRADIFSRGANEVFEELMHQAPRNQNLVLNENLAFYYPLPRFFITSKHNRQLIKRLTIGLTRAYKSGSLLTLWKKHYQASLDLVDLEHRTIFKLDNPFISNVDTSYEQYIYQPNAK